VRVVRRDGRLVCEAPCFRHPQSGKWLPAVTMPPELFREIAVEVLAEVQP
jgi:hypothetical protein